MSRQSGEWKVLFIDDEEDIRDVMAIELADAGYRVVTASDGEAGIRQCSKESPQIVITDIRMPGMDGLAVLEAIKKNHPDIEVIVVTAFGEMDVAIRALQLDASDFITKPVHTDALHLALNRAQERYATRRQVADYMALLEKENAKTSAELEENLRFQKNLIESAMDGIAGCNADESIVIFNRSLEAMLGLAKSDVLQVKRLAGLFFPEDYRVFKAALASDKHGGQDRLLLFETALKTRHGKRNPVQASAMTLPGADTGGGLVCFFRDLAEIRRLEREAADMVKILHQDKMMSLGRLASSVVHEINNPLAGIINYLKLMVRILKRGDLDEESRKKFVSYLEVAEKETSRCSGIVSSLLSFSRKKAPAFEPVAIGDLLEKSLALCLHKLKLSGIVANTHADESLPVVKGDANQLQQCLINLIFNAIDAMPGGGRIDIAGTFNRQKQRVEITVTDTGSGIPEDVLPNIFEPFFTTKNEGFGVGLGLSTLYGIIEQHGGTVDVDSTPGQGTIFTISLPVYRD